MMVLMVYIKKQIKAYIDKSIKRDDLKEWLNKQQTKQITNKTNLKKPFLPIYSDVRLLIHFNLLDLTFFPRYKKQNSIIINIINVLFTAININTRYAYAYNGKDKEMDTILQI